MLKHSMFAFVIVITVSMGALGAKKPFSCPEMPADDSNVREVAGDYFASASKAFKKKTFKKALKLFVSSLCIVDHPNTVYNIAQSVFYMKNKKTARKILKEYVKSREDSLSTLEIKKIINRLDGQLGQELSFPDVEVAEDSPAGPGEGPEAGEMFEDSPPESAPIPAAPPGSAPAPEPAEEEPLLEEEVREDGQIFGLTKMRFSSFVLMGAGAAALITGAILQGLSYSAKLKAEETTRFDVFEKESEKRRDLQAGAVACFVIGGVFATTGVVLFFLDRHKTTQKSGGLSLLPWGSGLAVSGTF